ncbi:diacylglycerol/lipid kinase family protein [Dongia soli]|uniref:Diacylglycerol kinase family lipid kinase n=1 Tax=Dongia soli TaxID=600628 RepID=A0ABU5EAZ6_9PROT|nr:diacylglycerol kinase family protein [Dongia soli]MDY0883424.1 diacylglycerol kinase family lipid kinase [Dongia soli]
MRATVIVNAKAGSLQGKSAAEITDHLGELFRNSGFEAQIQAVEGPAMMSALEQAAQRNVDYLIVGGGDGSVAYAGSLLVGKKTVLGILPLGTLNLVARDLNIPLDLEQAVQALGRGQIREIDVAQVNGRYFLSNAGLGFFARMAREREEQRHENRFGKWHAFVVALLHSVREAHRVEVTIDAGEGPRQYRTRAMLVTNNAFDSASLLRKDRLDGGRLGVHIARHPARTDLWRTFIRLFIGNWRRDPDVDVFETVEVTVQGRGRQVVDLSADGETFHERFPLRFRILPKALQVLAPAVQSADFERAAAT